MILWSLFVYAPMAHMVLGQRRISECCARRAVSDSGFRRRNGPSTLRRAFRLFVWRAVSWAPPSDNSEAAPCPPHAAWCSVLIGACLSVGWMVWVSMRAARSQTGNTGDPALFCGYPILGLALLLPHWGWGAAEWVGANGKTKRSRRQFRELVAGLVAITPAAGFVSPIVSRSLLDCWRAFSAISWLPKV